jgi:antitoxin (DNA-binding transcriptional repressor) of toxin-antitoxin stability system
MVTVSLNEFQSNSLTFVRRAQAGESILIADQEQPIAELKPVPRATGAKRPFGLCKGQFEVPEDFDAPLSEEILRDFEA